MLHARAVQRMSRLEVVGAVEDDIGLRHLLFKVFDSLTKRNDRDVGVDRIQRRSRGFDFRGANRFGAVEDLPLQVGEVDLVGVGEGEAADAGGGEVERGGTAEAARADDQRVGGAQLLLAFNAYLRQQDVPAIAEKLLVVNSFWSARLPATGSSPARP